MPSVADTSYLIALFQQHDPHHEKALARVQAGEVPLVPVPVLTECLQVILVGERARTTIASGHRLAREALAFLRDEMGCRFVPVTALEAAMSLYRDTPTLTLVDAIGVSESIARRADLWTFDSDQQKAFNALRR